MNGVIVFRADHELVGRVIAEKLKRRSSATDSSFRIEDTDTIDLLNRRRVASGRVG
jgi:hypothetical protein